jgi:ribonucleotide monophosphatase NagD (HAD superfamily)
MKVDLFYHDNDGVLFKHENTLNTVCLTKVNKKDIKHFKFTTNGNDKSPSIKNRDKELGNTEENVLQTST